MLTALSPSKGMVEGPQGERGNKDMLQQSSGV
jgi:hypothetical protein